MANASSDHSTLSNYRDVRVVHTDYGASSTSSSGSTRVTCRWAVAPATHPRMRARACLVGAAAHPTPPYTAGTHTRNTELHVDFERKVIEGYATVREFLMDLAERAAGGGASPAPGV